jgi:hypothetical protein
VLLTFFLVSLLILGTHNYNNRNSGRIFRDSAEAIKEIGFQDCKVLSNYWVPVNYYAGNVYFLGRIDHAIENNETILILKGYTTMDDQFNMEDIDKYEKLYDEPRFSLLGKEGLNNETCTKRHGWDRPMTTRSCEILSTKFEFIKMEKFAEKICLAINRK